MKQKQTYNKLKKKIKLLKFALISLTICFVIVSVSFFVLYIFLFGVSLFVLPINYTLNTTELDISERVQIENIFSQINPLYLQGQRKLLFTKNITKYLSLSEITKNEREGYITMGFNYGYPKGNIIIEYVKDEEILKEFICHELLHTFMKLDDKTHEIVYDLGRKKVCFE